MNEGADKRNVFTAVAIDPCRDPTEMDLRTSVVLTFGFEHGYECARARFLDDMVKTTGGMMDGSSHPQNAYMPGRTVWCPFMVVVFVVFLCRNKSSNSRGTVRRKPAEMDKTTVILCIVEAGATPSRLVRRTRFCLYNPGNGKDAPCSFSMIWSKG